MSDGEKKQEKEEKKEEKREEKEEEKDVGVVFKKKTRRGGKQKISKKILPTKEEKEEESDDDSGVSTSLEETRRKQQLRTRANGLDAHDILSSNAVEEEEEPDNIGLELESQFTGASRAAPTDRLMQQYIDDHMGKKKEVVEKTMDRNQQLMEEIYKLPQNLIPKDSGNDGEEDAPVALTNIPEVELSIDYKIKNIEETEKARRELEEKQRQRRAMRGEGEFGGNHPINFNSNFATRFRTQTQHKRPAPSSDPHSNDDYPNKKPKRDPNVSTDDLAMKRFKRNVRL